MTDRKIVEIAVFTDEVDRVREFYGRILGGSPEAVWPGGAIFSAERVKVLVHERAAATAEGPPNEDHVAIAAPDLDALAAELRVQGVLFLVEPRDFPWGRSAYLRDPDGRLVELSQQ